MKNLTKNELHQRLREIMNNLVVLTDCGKLSPLPLDKNGAVLTELFTHVSEEFALRFGPYPNGYDEGFLKDARIPNPSLPTAPKACNAVKQLKLDPGEYLIKYGKQKYLKPLLEEGELRINGVDLGSFSPPFTIATL
jgi:hypothetical protein